MPTTIPVGPSLLDHLASIPPVAWLVIAAFLAVIVRSVQIRLAAAGGPDESVARNTMTDIYLALRRITAGSADSIDSVRTAASNAAMELRVDNPTFDPRRIILHDDRPIRPIAAFPRMIRGRLVLLGTGRIVLVSESAFEKLLEADKALVNQTDTKTANEPDEDLHGEKRD